MKKFLFFATCLFVVLLYASSFHNNCSACKAHTHKITDVCDSEECKEKVNFLEHEDMLPRLLNAIHIVQDNNGKKKFKIGSDNLVSYFVVKHRKQNPRGELSPFQVNICLFYDEIGYIMRKGISLLKDPL